MQQTKTFKNFAMNTKSDLYRLQPAAVMVIPVLKEQIEAIWNFFDRFVIMDSTSTLIELFTTETSSNKTCRVHKKGSVIELL